MDKIGFAIVNIAAVVIVYMIYSIFRNENKKQTHYSFLALLIMLVTWILGTIILEYYYMATGKVSMVALNIAYIGLIFSSPCIMILGIVFAKSDRINFSWKYSIIFIIPILSAILLLTNGSHHLFYKYIKYEDLTLAASLGDYFGVHTVYSYACTLIGMALMVGSSIRTSGLFSRQSIFILLGILITFVFNFLLTMQIINVYFYTNGVAIFFTVLFFFIAIFKFKFLDLIPIAVQRVVNIISDGYVVLNERNVVIEYNRAFVKNISVSQGENFITKMQEDNIINVPVEELNATMEKVKKDNNTIVLAQKKLNLDDERYFDIEVSAIFLQEEYRGTILLFKDITQHVKDMETIKQSQAALVEQERLASLGQLAGGMAHDINTPIATIRMGIDFLNGKHEYSEQEVKMLEAMKVSASKITEIVESVRNQIRNTGESQKTEFSLNKVIDNIKILVNNELQKNKCKLFVDSKEDYLIYGDFGKLSQILMNIVMNAIQAYTGDNGEIRINTYKEKNNVVISVQDNAGGIPQKIAEGLFKEILTTKGTKGTGVGLYFANSMLKAEFNGEMPFETTEGIGSIFYIKIPTKKEE